MPPNADLENGSNTATTRHRIQAGVSEREKPDAVTTHVVPCSPPQPRPVFPVVGDSLLHFELIGQLGSGAFSRVFLASQRDLAGRLVALKVSEYTDGEPLRLARLQHANIVPIYSVHNVFQFQVVCMPYLGSHTLATLIQHQSFHPHSTGRQLVDTLRNRTASPAGTTVREARRPNAVPVVETVTALSPNLELLNRLSHVDAVLWIVARLADGLAHAHERGILHCDLKPHNVLLSDDGQPMLLDFNVSLDTRMRLGEQTQFGGTLPYMAPEHLEAVLSGNPTISVQADLYSLGVILYELLTGRDPHDLPATRPADHPRALQKIRANLPKPPSRWNSEVSPAVDTIVLKLLAPGPWRRYISAADLREDLERHLANRPLAHARNTSVIERMQKWRRRNPRAAAAAIAGTAVLALVVAPATVMAERQRRIAERQQEVQVAEARLQYAEALDQARAAQTLLSTQTGNRSLLDQGYALGRSVLEKFDVGENSEWQTRAAFYNLSSPEQGELRRELGELSLLMSHAELLRGSVPDGASARAALSWNLKAEACFPADQRPRWLAVQRAKLLKLVPGEARELPDDLRSDLDAYHRGLDEALDGRYADALIKLIPYSDRHPNHFMAWFVRGICHDGVGQSADGAAALTVCTALKPEMPWPYFSRGLIRLHQKQYEAAETDFDNALRLNPNFMEALINRAVVRQARRDWAGAETDLTAALEHANAPTRVYFLRSTVRRASGNVSGADEDAARALQQTPTDCQSWVTRGVWRLPDGEKALADFNEALKLDPRSRDALQNKAVVLADYLRMPKEAVAVLDQLLGIYPTHVEAVAGRGVYRARAGDVKGARRDAADCLRDDPTPFRTYQMAGLFAQVSRHESDGKARAQALRLLAVALRSGFDDFATMSKDGDLDPIRNSDEFRSLVAHAQGLHRH